MKLILLLCIASFLFCSCVSSSYRSSYVSADPWSPTIDSLQWSATDWVRVRPEYTTALLPDGSTLALGVRIVEEDTTYLLTHFPLTSRVGTNLEHNLMEGEVPHLFGRGDSLYLLTYRRKGGRLRDVLIRTFDPTRKILSGPRPVFVFPAGHKSDPQVVMSADSSHMVVWGFTDMIEDEVVIDGDEIDRYRTRRTVAVIDLEKEAARLYRDTLVAYEMTGTFAFEMDVRHYRHETLVTNEGDLYVVDLIEVAQDRFMINVVRHTEEGSRALGHYLVKRVDSLGLGIDDDERYRPFDMALAENEGSIAVALTISTSELKHTVVVGRIDMEAGEIEFAPPAGWERLMKSVPGLFYTGWSHSYVSDFRFHPDSSMTLVLTYREYYKTQDGYSTSHHVGHGPVILVRLRPDGSGQFADVIARNHSMIATRAGVVAGSPALLYVNDSVHILLDQVGEEGEDGVFLYSQSLNGATTTFTGQRVASIGWRVWFVPNMTVWTEPGVMTLFFYRSVRGNRFVVLRGVD